MGGAQGGAEGGASLLIRKVKVGQVGHFVRKVCVRKRVLLFEGL
jgi:hypothetical protein